AEAVADEPAPATERDEDSGREAHTAIPSWENVAPMREAATAEANAPTTVVWAPIATETAVGETIAKPAATMLETATHTTGEGASGTVDEPGAKIPEFADGSPGNYLATDEIVVAEDLRADGDREDSEGETVETI